MTSLLIIGHKFHYFPQSHFEGSQKGFYQALENTFERVTIHFVEDSWPHSITEIPDYQNYDVCMWFVLFRMLILQGPINWADFRGLRLWFEHDAHANYHDLLGKDFLGKFPGVFHRNKFHQLICTGKHTREMLEEENVPSFWLPKAYDPKQIQNEHNSRKGLCFYGRVDVSRDAMLRYLNRRRIPFWQFRCPYAELSNTLNRYAGCLICNMGAQKKGVLSKAVNRLFPGHGIGLNPGVEPMLKNFEVCGAGCAPIMDWIDEFKDLGFRDGESMVSYRSFPELADKLKHYLIHEDQLIDIGKRACELVQKRHTWRHRALELKAFIEQ